MTAKNCIVTVAQSTAPLAVEELAENLTLACSFTDLHCSGSPEVMWFSIHGNKTRKLCLEGCENTENSGNFQLQGPITKGNADLHIQWVTAEDSGVYYCGVAYRTSASAESRQIGNGTTLLVGGPRTWSLWLQSILIAILFIYAFCITINLMQTIRWTKKVDLLKRNPSSAPDEERKTQALHAVARELNSKFHQGNEPTATQQPPTKSTPIDESIYQNVNP